MKTLFTLAILWPVVLLAHIGSPNVFYEGSAGPYALRVIIQPPDVIPGLARITVRALASNVSKISVLPARWDTGTKGAPSPDPAKPVRGDANLFAAELWLMTGGAYSIIVNAEGASGTGTTVVPINSVATARRVMPRWFGGLLGAWGGALVLALISLIGAATRESALSPGETPSRGRIWRARATMVLGTGVIGLALWGGKVWWDAVDRDYRNNKLYRADRLYAEVRTNNSQAILELTRNVDRWGARPIIPEHGKLMHMFLVRQPDLEAFAHLHPVKTGEHSFESALPPLPAGKYRIYADITHESGFTQTLVSEVSLGADANATSFTPTDPDDSWRIGPHQPADDKKCSLPNGLEMRFLGASDGRLQFSVTGDRGQPAVLEPYMEMQAHAVVHSFDGSVFTHLHPFGTVSMTSQQVFAKRERERTGKPFEIICGLPARPDVIAFPYDFPKPGKYRIWVQVKIDGGIVTGTFDTVVEAT